MPTLIPPGFADVAVELRATGDPDPWYVTFGLDVSAAGGDIEAVGLRAMFAYGSMMGVTHTTVDMTGAFVTVGQDGPENIRQYVPSPITIAGSEPGAKLPQNCALLVRKNSGQGGRRARGRMFCPSVTAEGAVDNVGLIANDAWATYQAAATAMFESLLLDDPGPPMPMVILHGSEGSQPVGPPTPVSSLSVDKVIATQRRRLR